jgi:capsular polysaccharide biosynthesis protein
VNRFTRSIQFLGRPALVSHAARLDSLADSTDALGRGVRALQDDVTRLQARMRAAQLRTEDAMTEYRRRADERLRLGGVPRAKLLSDSIVLEGRPGLRVRVRRVSVGEAVERPFAERTGVTVSVKAAPDVQALWEGLRACEAAFPDAVLRGAPSTILDVGPAVVSTSGGRAVTASLVDDVPQGGRVLAVPRFTYDVSAQKLRNFGHWFLDCLPQVVALAQVAPDAVFLLPATLKGFHRSTLALVGLAPHQLHSWDGAPAECARLLLFESDGRAGGGRPLASLMDLRRIVLQGPGPAGSRRRIYVSRRDAKAKRRWMSNEPDVEAVFRSRGFEILVMADCPLDEQVRLFRDARIVAGPSGAGLADIVFSAPGTHVVVLLNDSLIRWYADQGGARSLWINDTRASGAELAALGDSPRFYAYLAAAFSQTCHSFLSRDQVPLDDLTGFLDAVIERVEREDRGA